MMSSPRFSRCQVAGGLLPTGVHRGPAGRFSHAFDVFAKGAFYNVTICFDAKS